MNDFRLPDLGEGLHEAEIVSWHVAEGEHIVSGQPLVSVETDKAVVEIPSPQSGHVLRLHGAPGDRIETGAVLVEFEGGPHGDTGAIVGEIGKAQAAPSAAAPARPAAVKAAPAVRAEAKRRGIDLAAVAPSGPGGQVLMADLDRHAAAPAPVPGRGEPVRGVRRAMAANMTRAGAEVVPATVTDVALVDHLTPDSDVTVRLVRAVAAGCAAEPALNAWFDSRAMARTVHDTVDLGLAVDTGDGLFAPVLRDVANRPPDDLRRGIDAMKADVVARRIPPEELRGQTITLSNFGTLGGRFAALVVVPPQVAIVGAGRIAEQVVAVGGKAGIHRTLPLSLTFDHRVVTGAEAARFLAAMIQDLERTD